jgi:gliding motility-associated-like protein
LFLFTVNIATAQVINISSKPSSVSSLYGTPSSASTATTSFTVSGSALLANVIVSPPSAFEVSLDNSTFTNILAIPVGAGEIISPTDIYIRLKSTTNVGTYTGDIILTSAGASVNVNMPASTVNRAAFSINVSDTKIYGETLTDFIEVSNGTNFSVVNAALKNGETASTLTIKYTAGNLPTAAVGTYVDAIQASNLTGTFSPNNYVITYVAGNVTVTPAPLLVTADNKSKFFGDPNPPFTITYTGFVNGEDASQLTTQPIAVTTVTQGSDVGVYPITVSGGSSPNYTLSYVDGALTVYKDISIPNTFTPNGDGVNDTWGIKNLSPNAKITVEVMSRYGARVYFSNGYSVPWDGYSNGVPVPFGVYYYVIKGVKQKPITGYVTVVR